MRFMVKINGQVTGPHEQEELADLARHGKLKPTDLVSLEGHAQWANPSPHLFEVATLEVAGVNVPKEMQPEPGRIGAIYDPESFNEYCSKVWDGEAVPSVYRSLSVATIGAGLAPHQFFQAWLVRDQLTMAVSTLGLVAMSFQCWVLGIVIQGIALIISMRFDREMTIRVGYIAVVEHKLGEWAMQKRFLSLRNVPPADIPFWRERNGEILVREIDFLDAPPDSRSSVRMSVLLILLTLARLGLSICIGVVVWRHPSALSLCIGLPVALFCGVQSAGKTLLWFSRG